uniref:hypothetical protein n=1 Tax=Thioalkalivibrio sp. ALE23 TaxID=1265495 RepID=UPI000363AF31
TIEKDEGEYRSIRFSAPNTVINSFTLTTWPGYIAISGDLGTYVFCRLPDMFEFFRQGAHGDPMTLSLGYWAEKCVAADSQHGIRHYSPEKFEQTVMEFVREAGQPHALIRAVEDDLLPFADEGEARARDAVHNFEYQGKEIFPDFWEVSLEEYSEGFIQACVAIIWGIRQYDAQRSQAA